MKPIITFWAFLFIFSLRIFPQLIVDHTCTNITQIPQSALEQAKMQMHIAYGHTSHGSQVTEGMEGLVEFANNGGRGLSLSDNIFQWNNGGSGGVLDLHDYAMGGDVGYWPDWYDNTVNYLNDPANDDVNVVMWSWCGQVGGKYESGVLWEEYLEPMSTLEENYPEVTFVYMTGHLDYWGRANTNAANDSIRSYCHNNNKVLFDFADIESYGADGTCYKENGNDNCDYYNSSDEVIGNWAQEYQISHVEGVDWYSCGSAHSEPFNANLKAYAAWWMFASLAGWNCTPPVSLNMEKSTIKGKIYPNPATDIAFFEVTARTADYLKVDLLTCNGALVESNLTPFRTSGTLVFRINTSNLESSIYFVRLISQDKTQIYKLIII